MPRQTPRELADLRDRFLESGEAATVSQGSKADQAYAFINRVAGFATAAQGAQAATAFSWGNHAVVGYLTLATVPLFRKSVGTDTTSPVVLSPAPVSDIQVFVDVGSGAILRTEGTDYTVAGDTVTFDVALQNATYIYHIFYQG